MSYYKDQYQILNPILWNKKQQEIKASGLFGVVLRLISCYNLDTHPLSTHTHTQTQATICAWAAECVSHHVSYCYVSSEHRLAHVTLAHIYTESVDLAC